jgi:hypothetical protein
MVTERRVTIQILSGYKEAGVKIIGRVEWLGMKRLLCRN